MKRTRRHAAMIIFAVVITSYNLFINFQNSTNELTEELAKERNNLSRDQNSAFELQHKIKTDNNTEASSGLSTHIGDTIKATVVNDTSVASTTKSEQDVITNTNDSAISFEFLEKEPNVHFHDDSYKNNSAVVSSEEESGFEDKDISASHTTADIPLGKESEIDDEQIKSTANETETESEKNIGQEESINKATTELDDNSNEAKGHTLDIVNDSSTMNNNTIINDTSNNDELTMTIEQKVRITLNG